MDRNHFLIGSVAAAVLLGVNGCATTPELDRHFGETVNLVKAQQTLNPAAALNTNPVKGMDGKAAKSGYDAYQKSYATPEPKTNSFTIGVGSR
jgi:hypothetical protein